MNWAELAQEFPVPKCDSARSVNLDRVLVVLTYLNDTARLVPFVGVKSCLVLYADEVPYRKWWMAFSVLRPGFSCADVASSLALSVSRQVSCGLYFPRIIKMKSRVGRPKTHIAGEIFVSGSGVLRYCSIAICTASVSSSPFGPVLSVMSRFIVFTPISARQLLWGKATDDRRWCTPHLCRKDLVSVEVNSGPPSDASSSGVPYVTKARRKWSMRPVAPPVDCDMIGQFEYLSTVTR